MGAPTIPILVSLSLVGGLGVVHGIFTDRWAPSGQLQAALEGVPRVPMQFGSWKGEELPVDLSDLDRMGIKGCLMRQYRNPDNRETVSLLIVCGRGGPICVHTPDICYVNAGYKQISNEEQRVIESSDGRKAAFIEARFGKPDGVVPTQLEILWAWSRDGIEWQTPENPRLSLARSPALYKLYVVREFIPRALVRRKLRIPPEVSYGRRCQGSGRHSSASPCSINLLQSWRERFYSRRVTECSPSMHPLPLKPNFRHPLPFPGDQSRSNGALTCSSVWQLRSLQFQ